MLVREALETHNVEGELFVIADGDAAIRYIQALETLPMECPDLVIIDLNLPKRPGREVIQTIRQGPKWRDTAVVVLSSSDAQRDRTESMSLGASQYFRKPIRLREFLDLGRDFKAILIDSSKKE
jgi:DNA-binding response OmpR family regulator